MHRHRMKVFLPILVAAAALATVFGLLQIFWALVTGMALMEGLETSLSDFAVTFIVVVCHLVFLVPVYLLFRAWWVSCVFGFIFGSVPSAIFACVWDSSKYGMPPMSGWSVCRGICETGLIGVVCGFVAWLTWRALMREPSCD